MHRSAAEAILMARRPMDRTALRTKSISTSEAYLQHRNQYEGRGEETRNGDSLLQLCEDLLDVLLVREAEDDLELGEFDVDGVIVLAKEDLDVIAEHHGSSLDDEEDISKGNILNLVSRRQQCD